VPPPFAGHSDWGALVGRGLVAPCGCRPASARVGGLGLWPPLPVLGRGFNLFGLCRKGGLVYQSKVTACSLLDSHASVVMYKLILGVNRVASNIDRFKNDLADLRHRGILLQCAMVKDSQGESVLRKALGDIDGASFDKICKEIPEFSTGYEAWYSECIAVIRQLLPDRLAAFKDNYEKPKVRKEIDYENYVIKDYMLGLRVTLRGDVKVGTDAAIPKMKNQCAILGAVEARFKSSLFEIRQIVQADLFDSEISSARELHNNKFYRAAGAVAGVVLEKHLAQVCNDHNITVSKKNPTIGDLNEALKAAGTIDVPQWRHISMLGDIRNICDHNKRQEPTDGQVTDLIDGTDKVLKTVV